MENEVEINRNKKFPWGAAAIFGAASLIVGIYTMFTVEAELGLESDAMAVAGIFGVVTSLVSAVIGAGLQYVFTKFPTQWISKEKDVYKYDIWSAIFYSSAITLILNLLIQQFNLQESLMLSSLVSIISTGLFLFFYFSGEEKKSNVKKAITIVQIIWLVLGIAFSIAVLMFVNSLGI